MTGESAGPGARSRAPVPAGAADRAAPDGTAPDGTAPDRAAADHAASAGAASDRTVPDERGTDPEAAPVAALLQAVSDLRLSTAVELSMVAAAVDEDRPDVAVEHLEAHRQDVAALLDRG